MTTEEGPSDPALAHLPSAKALYDLTLLVREEQIVEARRREGRWENPGNEKAYYPALAELFSDVDEIADMLGEESPSNAAVRDYRVRWAELDRSWETPEERQWWMTPVESRARWRLLKRFLIRVGLLSPRRAETDESEAYWDRAAREYR